ncbi:MAG: enoyl-CoA hydratase/isomerase family protein [Saprospiraceae bacterium]
MNWPWPAIFAWPRKRQIRQPEVNLGTIPAMGGTQRLVRLVGLGRATLATTGEMIDAPTALQAGLITGIYPGERLQDEP